LIIQLGGYVGLRAFEIPQVTPKQVKRTEGGEHFRLRIPEGKDTSGGGGKPRDAYLPADVERDLHQFQTAKDIDRGEPFMNLSERSVRNVVKRTAERAAEQTGDDDFRYVSSHDLRWRYAQRLLVGEGVIMTVVVSYL
jgi:integrase